jgi:hypothetical protein
MENASGSYVNFMTMDKEQLIAAAEQREKAAHTSLGVARLERRIASTLEAGQVVGDIYSPEEVEGIYAEIQGVRKEVAA